jgi:hypothetical protein
MPQEEDPELVSLRGKLQSLLGDLDAEEHPAAVREKESKEQEEVCGAEGGKSVQYSVSATHKASASPISLEPSPTHPQPHPHPRSQSHPHTGTQAVDDAELAMMRSRLQSLLGSLDGVDPKADSMGKSKDAKDTKDANDANDANDAEGVNAVGGGADYRLNMTGSRYGECQCGFLRHEHPGLHGV